MRIRGVPKRSEDESNGIKKIIAGKFFKSRKQFNIHVNETEISKSHNQKKIYILHHCENFRNSAQRENTKNC